MLNHIVQLHKHQADGCIRSERISNKMDDNIEWTLISLVKKESVLYNTATCESDSNASSTASWQRVSSKLGFTPQDCKGKWRKLRDTYVKCRKRMRQEEDSGLEPRKPTWRFFQPMDFLAPHISHRHRAQNTHMRMRNEMPARYYNQFFIVLNKFQLNHEFIMVASSLS